MASLGGFVVQHSYRVDKGDFETLRELLGEIRGHAEDLGLSGFEVWLDDDETGLISELHGYDSWSHWRRLSEKESPPWMRNVYERLDAIIEGGLGAVQTRSWQAFQLPI